MLISLLTMYLPAQEEISDKAEENTSIQLDETQFRITTSEPAEQDSASTNSIWLFVRMVLVLALVIVCIYVVVFLLRRGLNPRTPSDLFLKKAASLTLSPGKSVHVVTLQDYAYIVGTADNSISLLGEIKDKELIDALNLQSEVYLEKAPDFASLLSLLCQNPKNPAPAKTDFGENSIQIFPLMGLFFTVIKIQILVILQIRFQKQHKIFQNREIGFEALLLIRRIFDEL